MTDEKKIPYLSFKSWLSVFRCQEGARCRRQIMTQTDDEGAFVNRPKSTCS